MNKKRFIIEMFLSVALLLVTLTVSAQERVVKGQVVDEAGEPIIGATVLVEGMANKGVITDIDGNYTIIVPDKQKLVISFIGYTTQVVNDLNKTKVVLKEDLQQLDEVVVVGYGAVKKSDLTGSVASVKTTEEEAARSTSFDKLLQGKAAGVTVSTGSAAPGGSVSVRIRGTSSLRGDNSPLYVIDGNIISGLGDTMDPMAAGTGGGNSRADAQNPLASISHKILKV